MDIKYIPISLILVILFLGAGETRACTTPPVADLTADPCRVAVDVGVTLDGSGSYDPDGGSITKYE